MNIQKLSRLFPQILLNLCTLIVVALMLLTHQTGAAPATIPVIQATIPMVIPYQGSLTNATGQALTGTVNIVFRLYNATTGSMSLWTEIHTGVLVEKGLFRALLGSVNAIPSSIWNSNPLYLGVQVGNDPEMLPRELIGTVPYAIMAQTVPNEAINTIHIAGGAITSTKIANEAVLTANIADEVITTAKIANEAVTQYQGTFGPIGATTSSTTFVDIPAQNITLITQGGAVLVLFSGSHMSDTSGAVGYWQIIRDNTMVLAHNNETYDNPVWRSISLFGIDQPSAGTHTYKVQWRTSVGTLTASSGVYYENLAAIEMKR